MFWAWAPGSCWTVLVSSPDRSVTLLGLSRRHFWPFDHGCSAASLGSRSLLCRDGVVDCFGNIQGSSAIGSTSSSHEGQATSVGYHLWDTRVHQHSGRMGIQHTRKSVS